MSRAAIAALCLLGAAAPAQATFIATVQPVGICLDDGANCAAPAFDGALLRAFWLAQAGVSLDILPLRQFDSTAFQTMDSVAEVLSLLHGDEDPAGPAGFESSPITAWFAASSFLPPGTTGLALVDSNRIWIAANLDPAEQTRVLAHELGHAFGLDHSFDPFNLMTPFSDPSSLGDFGLLPGQVAEIQASRFVTAAPDVVAAPAPSALALFLIGLGGLAWRRTRAGPAAAVRERRLKKLLAQKAARPHIHRAQIRTCLWRLRFAAA